MKPGVFHSRRDLRIETVAYPGVPGVGEALDLLRSGVATKVIITPGVPPAP